MRAIDYFDKGAEVFPDRIAIRDRATQYSYLDAQQASQRIAKAMWAAGLRGEEGPGVEIILDETRRELVPLLTGKGGTLVRDRRRRRLTAPR